MSVSSTTAPAAREFGTALWSNVLTRDDAHLAPKIITKAAAKRLRRGIRALEAFVRRVLILLALELEPGLKPSDKEPCDYRYPKRPRGPLPSVSIFTGEGVPLESFNFPKSARAYDWRPDGVPAFPLLRKLIVLKDILDDPASRAKRLAFHLARKRPGLLVAPDVGKGLVPSRYGTEVSALYHAFGFEILELSRARPPPLPPALRARPRIRVL